MSLSEIIKKKHRDFKVKVLSKPPERKKRRKPKAKKPKVKRKINWKAVEGLAKNPKTPNREYFSWALKYHKQGYSDEEAKKLAKKKYSEIRKRLKK